MSVRGHRVAAVSILACGIIVVFAWGRSMAVDSGDVRAVREKFQGAWVSSSIKAGAQPEIVGARAQACSAIFDGKRVTFHGMVDDIDASGTYYIEASHPNWVDFKLDAGWIIGLFEVEGDTLKLCLNPFAMPERLGVPTLARPRSFDPGDRRHVYVFRRSPADR